MKYLKQRHITPPQYAMIWALLSSLLLLTGCATDRELFAQYNALGCQQSCESTPLPDPHIPWHLSVYFDTDKAQLTEIALKKLSENLAVLQGHPDRHLLIRGFTDLRASQQYNLRLSNRRTQAVLHYFTQQDIKRERLLLQPPFGETSPILLGNIEAHLKENRRVEMILVEADGHFIPLEAIKHKTLFHP